MPNDTIGIDFMKSNLQRGLMKFHRSVSAPATAGSSLSPIDRGRGRRRQAIPCREGLYLPVDPPDQFREGRLMSHLNELGHPLLNELFDTANPIDRPSDLLGEKITDLLLLKRFNRPVVEDRDLGEAGCQSLSIYP